MSVELHIINRRIELDELEKVLEAKFVFNKILKEIDDPVVICQYLKGYFKPNKLCYLQYENIVLQIQDIIDNFCKKYKLKNMNELKFKWLTNYEINSELSFGMYCMGKYNTDFWYRDNFIKYMNFNNLDILCSRTMKAVKRCRNTTYMPPEAYEIPKQIETIKNNFNQSCDYLILSYDNNDMGYHNDTIDKSKPEYDL